MWKMFNTPSKTWRGGGEEEILLTFKSFWKTFHKFWLEPFFVFSPMYLPDKDTSDQKILCSSNVGVQIRYKFSRFGKALLNSRRAASGSIFLVEFNIDGLSTTYDQYYVQKSSRGNIFVAFVWIIQDLEQSVAMLKRCLKDSPVNCPIKDSPIPN